MVRKPQKRATTSRSGGAKRGRSGVSRRAVKERTPANARKTRSIRPNRKKKPKKTWRKARLQVPWRKAAFGTLYGVSALVAGGAITYGSHQAYLHVTTTELFALETIEVNGLTRATREDVMSLAEVAEGHNLIALDASMMEERIARHPWVITADVMRRPPRSLEIRVVEHEPVALASLDGLYFTTADGEVVKRYDGEEVTLPVVTGLRVRRTPDGQMDHAAAQADIRRAVRFLDALKEELSEDTPVVDQIHVDPVRGLSFQVMGSKTRISMGRAPWRTAIRRWKLLASDVKRRGIVATSIALGGARRPERAVVHIGGARDNER